MSASGLKNAFPRYPGGCWLSVVDNQSLRLMIPLLRFFGRCHSLPSNRFVWEGVTGGKEQYMTGLLLVVFLLLFGTMNW
jgi:hypothetical protein